jgi:hypothetical protein
MAFSRSEYQGVSSPAGCRTHARKAWTARDNEGDARKLETLTGVMAVGGYRRDGAG